MRGGRVWDERVVGGSDRRGMGRIGKVELQEEEVRREERGKTGLKLRGIRS